jgi:Replication protein
MYVDQWGEIHDPPDAEKAKPLDPPQLAGTGEIGVSGLSDVGQKAKRYGTAKARNRQMADHLVLKSTESLHAKAQYGRLAQHMYDCASWLAIHHYPTLGQTLVGRATTCKKHLLCPVCAILRGGKMLKRYAERAEHLAPAHDFELVTLTVKNGPDLWERFLHLKHAFKRLRERGKKGYGPWAPVAGAVWSTEFTHSAEGWHPHLHIITAKAKGSTPFRYGQGSDLAHTWLDLTGDSFIVHAAPIAGDPESLPGALCEVLKYALKFSDLTLDDNLHAYNTLKGKRLLQSSGCFYGLDLADDAELVDDPLDAPYVEFLFHYTSTGYKLQHVHSPHTPKGHP